MDRATWLRERRAAVVAEYDLESHGYDDTRYPTTSHAAFVDRLVATVPAGGLVLDAPCGTGQYFARIRDAGRRVVGIDQSAGMLREAEAQGLAERLEHVGLQEMSFDRTFDAAVSRRHGEHPTRRLPIVLENLVRAIRRSGHLYLTVEEIEDSQIDDAFESAQSTSLPTVRGEVVEGDTAGYHFYPGRDRVRSWLAEQRLEIVAEATDHEPDWGYWHLLLRTPVS